MACRVTIYFIGLSIMPILVVASAGSKSAYAQAKLDAYYTATLLGLPIGHISWVIVSALGQSASGSIDVADDHVRLEVFLPWFLAKLVGTIQPLIRKEGTLLLEKKK
jgi:hypothetical protein